MSARTTSIPLNRDTETRGTLFYWNGFDVVSQAGWFRLADDGHTILARKPRGNSVWRISNMEDATAFFVGA